MVRFGEDACFATTWPLTLVKAGSILELCAVDGHDRRSRSRVRAAAGDSAVQSTGRSTARRAAEAGRAASWGPGLETQHRPRERELPGIRVSGRRDHGISDLAVR